MDTSLVTDTVTRIFADLADPQTINAAAERDWAPDLWRALEENGITRAWIPEALGGSGLSMAEGFAIVQVAGRFALAVPLVETMIAGWLLASAGLHVPDGPMTVAPARPQDRIRIDREGVLSGTAHNVPFADTATHLAILAEDGDDHVVALVRGADVETRARPGLSEDRRSDVAVDGVRPIAFARAPAGLDRSSLMQMGAAVRSLQIAGALQAILAISVDYANERVAFGKTIGRFQAVQHNLARLADEAAAAGAAAASVADAIAADEGWNEGVFLEAAAAKIRAGEAVDTGVPIAHQVHGAIGLTVEHILHRFTLRAQEWSGDFGTDVDWSVTLGRRLAAAGGDALWPLLTSR